MPLFVEELTKSVLESGLLRAETDRYVIDGALPPLAIPASLYASLLARLDRQKSARLAAQIGAVIGREFTYGLLRAVWALSEDELQTAVARLVASELVYQRGMPPDAVYSFKHALVRDAAYGSLLRGSRQELHALIAQALQAQSGELMETQPELFAWHYAEAGLVEKSVGFWAKAGQRSAARSALAEAAAQYQKGLDQLALLPETPERLRQQLEFCSALGAALRAVKGLAAPETGQAYAQALELWEQLGSPMEFVEIPFGLSRYHAYRGEFDLALRLDEDLLRLSRQRNDSVGLVLGHLSSGRTLMYAGRSTHPDRIWKPCSRFMIRFPTAGLSIRSDFTLRETHRHAWRSSFSVSAIRSRHWHGATRRLPRLEVWPICTLWFRSCRSPPCHLRSSETPHSLASGQTSWSRSRPSKVSPTGVR